MRKFKIKACGYSYECINWEMEAGGEFSGGGCCASESVADHKWEFVDSEIVGVGTPELTGYYEGEGEWQIFEVMPDGSEKGITDEEVPAQ